jgi:hypothetical protein
MRIGNRVTQELREWAHRPPAIAADEAARMVSGRLGAQAPPPRRPVLRPALVAATAALIVVVAVYSALRGHAARRPQASTTAALTLPSGTQVVIQLEEVKP